MVEKIRGCSIDERASWTISPSDLVDQPMPQKRPHNAVGVYTSYRIDLWPGDGFLICDDRQDFKCSTTQPGGFFQVKKALDIFGYFRSGDKLNAPGYTLEANSSIDE